MVSFDYGMASIFGQWQTHMGDGDATVEYVNVIKDIFKLDYGPISTPIIFMWCAWVRNKNDVNGNPTYKQNEVGFLVCNFWYMMARMKNLLFFPPKFNKCSSWMNNKILHGKWWSKRNLDHPTSCLIFVLLRVALMMVSHV